MGRKNNNARDLSVKERKSVTPLDLKRDAEAARRLLSGVYTPFSTPKDFTFTVSTVVSPSVLEELTAIYGK